MAKGSPRYEIEFYEEPDGTKPALRWIKEDLLKVPRRALGFAMKEVLQEQGADVVGSKSWGRQLRQGLIEFRLDRTVSNGEIVELVLRVFFHPHGDKKLLILHGYDKGADPSPSRQRKEIAVARQRLKVWKQRRAQERKKARRTEEGESASGKRKRGSRKKKTTRKRKS